MEVVEELSEGKPPLLSLRTTTFVAHVVVAVVVAEVIADIVVTVVTDVVVAVVTGIVVGYVVWGRNIFYVRLIQRWTVKW